MSVPHGEDSAAAFAIEALGEDALLLRVLDRRGIDANRHVHALAALLRAERPHWLREVVPAYATLAVQVDLDALAAHADPLGVAWQWLETQARRTGSGMQLGAARALDIPVCYGGSYGPDLDAVAARARLPTQEVIDRHTAALYTVAMLGFAPGFPYLLGLDGALAMPRLDTPRTRVAAGSVGIGGTQTGIYPREGPGGWRLIGRTPLALFDAARRPPSLLQPGQAVRFVAIDADTFAQLAAGARRRRRA